MTSDERWNIFPTAYKRRSIAINKKSLTWPANVLKNIHKNIRNYNGKNDGKIRLPKNLLHKHLH